MSLTHAIYNSGLNMVIRLTTVGLPVLLGELEIGSDMLVCTLDMQKAFDQINLIKLFNRPALRQLPVHIVRVLFLLYSQLSLLVF